MLRPYNGQMARERGGVGVKLFQEARADNLGHAFEIEERQEVDGLEVAVDGWGAADAGADGEVSAEQSGWTHIRRGLGVRRDRKSEGIARDGAKRGLGKEFAQAQIHRGAFARVL